MDERAHAFRQVVDDADAEILARMGDSEDADVTPEEAAAHARYMERAIAILERREARREAFQRIEHDVLAGRAAAKEWLQTASWWDICSCCVHDPDVGFDHVPDAVGLPKGCSREFASGFVDAVQAFSKQLLARQRLRTGPRKKTRRRR